jgi:hypothetical protein
VEGERHRHLGSGGEEIAHVLEIYGAMNYGGFVSAPTPTDAESLRRRRTNIRVIFGIVILLLVAWCYSIGSRMASLVHQGSDLARGSSRLESVDTVLAPGSRVEFNGATVADLRSTGHLGPASAHPNMDTIALFHRWPALIGFIQRDSARFAGADRRGPTPGIAAAKGFLTGTDAGDLYLGEYLAGADTARLAHDTTMFATIDSLAPLVVRLHNGPHPSGPMRGELFIGPPTSLFRVY